MLTLPEFARLAGIIGEILNAATNQQQVDHLVNTVRSIYTEEIVRHGRPWCAASSPQPLSREATCVLTPWVCVSGCRCTAQVADAAV